MRTRARAFLTMSMALGACGGGVGAVDAATDAAIDAPAAPTYADITLQSRCVRADGSPIEASEGLCHATGIERDLYGFSGDMNLRFSCTIVERTSRAVNFTVSGEAQDGTSIGVSLANAVVPIDGGAPTGTCQFTWTDGNEYGGNCGAEAPSATQPCQVQSIMFLTDVATDLPRMDVNVLCFEAPSIPAQTPPILASLSRPGSTPADAMSAMTIRFYSCPVVMR